MQAQRIPTIDDIATTIDAGRRRLAEVDVADASSAAIRSVREALPAGWAGRKEPTRWPLVAAIMLGVTVIGLVFMTPMFRRWSVSARSVAERQETTGPSPWAADAASAADHLTDEMID